MCLNLGVKTYNIRSEVREHKKKKEKKHNCGTCVEADYGVLIMMTSQHTATFTGHLDH